MTNPTTRLIIAGTPQTTVIIATALHQAGYPIQATLSPFPKKVGRKQLLTPSNLEQWSLAQQIPVIHIDKELLLKKEELQSKLPEADLLIVADFGFLIPAWLLQQFSYGGLNIHPSLLPRWRGATPVPFTLLFGDKITGVTLIQMNEKFDVGPIIAQEESIVNSSDTTPTLLQRLFELGAALLVKTLPQYLANVIHPTPQPTHSSTPITPRLRKDDGYIPFDVLQAMLLKNASQHTTHSNNTLSVPFLQKYDLPTNAQYIHQMIRALQPWPQCWTILPNGKRMIMHSSKIANGTLTLELVQIEGKNTSRFAEVKNQVLQN